MLQRVRQPAREDPREHLHRLGSLLGRWHQWRRHYSHERGHARLGGPSDPEDELEALLMASIENEVVQLSPAHQRALQHVARAECLGVETLIPGECPEGAQARETVIAQAMREIVKRLRRTGVL